ncbi:putative methionyl-tRNA synthetase [Hordeum vulgare]|nr:putative methionyl-tRNA synthetase [Hordeum vulgare]
MEAPPDSSFAPAAPPASSLPPPVTPPPASASATPAPAPSSLPPPMPEVPLVVAVGTKRRRAGQHVVLPQPAPATASITPVVASVAPAAAAPKVRKKPSLGPKGEAAPKVKKTTFRKKPTPAPAPAPPPVVHEVLDGMPAPPTSFMGLLEEAEVDIGAPPLEPFGFGDDLQEEGDEEEEGEDEEEVTEIEEDPFAAIAKPTVRSTNYTKDEDILLVRAWAHVGLDASTGTDQTGKRYCQRIEDVYCKIKPKTGGHIPRSYQSFQGRWELMKPHCACWSAAMDQVKDAPPSGTVESDDWKLRDQETAPKKSAMLRMDDSEEEGRNEHKPAGNKKDNLRKKMEGEASSIREKIEHMMKSREALTMKTLETKLLINEKKKEVKLAQVEARREDAKRKADLEERMIKVKEAKTWKELVVEEKEHMMMSKKDMDEDQLMWWKEYKKDIAERKRIFRGASSTLRGDTPMSGGGDGGVEDSTTGDNEGA